MKNLNKLILTPLFIASLSVSMQADDVVDTLNQAIKSYESGDYGLAAEDLNYVLQIIKQKKGEKLTEHLPEALPGWTAEKATSQAVGAGMLGGGIITTRKYKKDSSRIMIEITSDSPMMQGMMGLFSNPMFAASSGGKLERINREKAIVKYNEQRQKGDITIVVAKRFMIKVEGSKVSVDDLKAYAKAIDFRKLKALP